MTQDAMARLAGFLYLAALPTAGFCYGYVAFMPHGDEAATLAWLAGNRQALGWTIVAGAVGFVDYVVMGVLLRHLLAPVSKLAADLMLMLIIASVPITMVALADRIDLLALIDGAPPLPFADAMAHIRREQNLFTICAIFWGLWMWPLAWLIWRSGLAPRLFAALLLFGGFGYLLGFVGPVLDAHYPGSTLARLSGYVFIAPDMLGELGFGLWILIFGARGMKSGRALAA